MLLRSNGAALTGLVVAELAVGVCFLISPGDLLTDALPANEPITRKVSPGP